MSTKITDKQIAAAQAKIEARKRFEAVFPLLVEELISHLQKIHLPENAIEWYKEVSQSCYIGLIVEYELQYPWREIESWTFSGGYIPNSRWETFGG